MYLAYMDESGNTGTNPDPNQPIHIIGCLVVEDVRVRALEDAIRAVAQKYFAEQATKPRFEFHGVDMFGGKGFFKGDPQVRIDATRELIAAAVEYGATFGYCGVDKLKSRANDHPHRISFTMLTEQLEDWLDRKDSLALLISDENHEVAENLIADIKTFKISNTQWGYKQKPIKRIVDSLHFVKSYNNPIIQVADVLTYLKQKDLTARDKHLETFRKLESKDMTWPQWLDRECSESEKITIALVKDNTLRSFASKIWPLS